MAGLPIVLRLKTPPEERKRFADAGKASAEASAPAKPPTDPLQPGSVWAIEPHDGSFTVLKRDGER